MYYFLVLALVVGYNARLLSQDKIDKQDNNNEVDVYPNVQKNKLFITSNFYTVEIPKYDHENKSLKMNMQLNSAGRQYLVTSLFIENCNVSITLSHSETGEEYYVSEDYTWNINEVFNVAVEYYDDGFVNITYIKDNGDIIVYSPNVNGSCSLDGNSKSLIASSVFFAIVKIYNIVEVGVGIYDFTCKILEMTGNGAVCDSITQEIIRSITTSSATYEVERIFYKDTTCPYPPNSQMCSQPPYGYYKTYYKRIV